MAFRGRGAAPSLKPENAIKRADELVSVGQRQNALQTLHDTITNKRQQRNWTKAYEQVWRAPSQGGQGQGGVHAAGHSARPPWQAGRPAEGPLAGAQPAARGVAARC